MPRYQDPKEADRIMRAAGAIPLEPYKNSQAKWKCKCKNCKEVIYPSLAPIKNRGVSPCQKCAALEMGARRRAKSEAANIVILKKAKLIPLEPFPGNSKPWKVRCTKCKKVSNPHFSTVKNGSACIYCAGVKIDEKDVRRIYLAAGFEPIGEYPGKTKILWKAKHKKCGVISSPSFQAVKRGGGCRTCSGTVLVTAKQAHSLFIKNQLEPIEPYIDTTTPWKSKCLKCGKIVSPNYNKVRLRGHQCGYCAGNIVDAQDAIKLMKKSGFKTLVPYPGGNKPWKSECAKCKRVTSPSYTNVSKGIGCKYCAGRAVVPSEAIDFMNERGFIALEPYPGATSKWRVKCKKCKNEFQTYLYSMNTVKGCKYCAGIEVDMKVVNLRMEELQLQPLVKFPGATTGWKSKCLVCQRIVTPNWSHLRYRNSGCAFCSKKRVDKKEVTEMLKKSRIKPVGIFVNGKTPWQAKCLKCKKTIYIRVNDMRAGQSGCPYCAGVRVDEIDALKLANRCGFFPLVKYPGANIPWKCKCKVCGKISNPRYTTMQQRQGGCKYCKVGGFDFKEPAIIYLITHDKFGAHKIGVAGAAKHNERLDKHRSQGWKVYKHREFKVGEDAYNIEQNVIHWLFEKKGLPPYLAPEQMPQGGSSETVDASEIDLTTIWAKVEQLSKVQK
jgi:hypothetical protein